jgi:hypothetical protein
MHVRRIWRVGVVLLLSLAFVGSVGAGGSGGSCLATPSAAATTNVEIPNGEFYIMNVTVEAGDQVFLQYEITGGRGNDIDLLILDPANLLLFGSNKAYASLLSKEKTTSGVTLYTATAGGDLHVVFSNKFSAVSSKSVSISDLITRNLTLIAEKPATQTSGVTLGARTRLIYAYSLTTPFANLSLVPVALQIPTGFKAVLLRQSDLYNYLGGSPVTPLGQANAEIGWHLNYTNTATQPVALVLDNGASATETSVSWTYVDTVRADPLGPLFWIIFIVAIAAIFIVPISCGAYRKNKEKENWKRKVEEGKRLQAARGPAADGDVDEAALALLPRVPISTEIPANRVICAGCGMDNDPNSTTCSGCGHRLQQRKRTLTAE